MSDEVDILKKAKEKAVRLLARRDHSAFELKAKLKQRLAIDEKIFAEVMAYLEKYNLMVSEDKLADGWIKQWRGEGRGRRWMTGKLKTKGLPVPALRDDDEEREAAQMFLDKKLGSKSLKSLSYDDRMRLARSMISRGFSHAIVGKLVNQN